MRTTFEIRSKLEAAAAASGRSLAQEAEFRIERSFQREGLLREVLTLTYGQEFADFLAHLHERRKLAFRDVDREKMHEALEIYLGLLPGGEQ